MTEANPGRFHRVEPTVLDDDPFWSVVRRRHPDVDVVLLPEEPPAEARVAGPPASLEEVRRSAAAVQEGWREIRSLLAESGPQEPPSIRWQDVEGRRSLTLKKAVTGIGQDGGNELLQQVFVHFGDQGWALHPGGRDGLPVLRATDGVVAVEAIAGPGATVVTLAGVPLEVASDVAQVVKDDLRAEVASWQ